ncbi:MAG: hypothetical protein M8357_16915, partial [Desulfobulbaceae bacterium]|nr:hypothetical protein [Desulfobulbaceae bacterium]
TRQFAATQQLATFCDAIKINQLISLTISSTSHNLLGHSWRNSQASSSESAHSHALCEVLSFYITGRNMLRLRVALHLPCFCSYALAVS